jgi:hypothetical protein
MMISTWAQDEFGEASMGDPRRTKRVVQMASRLGANPGGPVAQVYPKGKEREAAYRLLESPYVRVEALERARDVACMRRMEERGGTLAVPVDKTSIQLSDRAGERNFGSVGNRRLGSRGVQVITGLALDAAGAPLGVAHQVSWARSETPSPPRLVGHKSRKRERDRRPPDERESMRWVDVLTEIHALAQEYAPSARLWFQLDREGDFWGVHKLAAELGVWTTVRMNKSHVVRDTRGSQAKLMVWMKVQPITHWIDLHLPAHDGRPERVVRLSVRFAQAQLRLPVAGQYRWVTKSFVYVDEPHRPAAKDRIQWLLSTTCPVHTIADAVAVIDHYKRRWRIEDFHRTWKSGCCDIESSQLQSMSVFQRWAILTSSMAARAEHIKHYAREFPDAPATLIFTQEEIDAVVMFRRIETPKARIQYNLGEIPKLSEMTRWVAELGGFMKSSKVVPGAVTIARGLAYLEPLVLGRRLGTTRADDNSG